VFLNHARLALMQIEAGGEAARRSEQPEKPGVVAGFLAAQEVIWLSETLRILREEASGVEITLSSKSSAELADALMQGKVDVALLRHETQTACLAFKFLFKEPLVAILPRGHRLAARKAVRPEELAREAFISPARLAPVLKSVINDYAAKAGITLKQKYDAETISGGNVVGGINWRCDAPSALCERYIDPVGCRSSLAGRTSDYQPNAGLQQVQLVASA
jgi:LysR family hca operon transcriptional activator